jgi:hypothetical protein
MGDHFWPSAYPGIIVGVMYGFATGGFKNALIGGVGGLIAAAAALLLLGDIVAGEGILPLAGLLGLSLAGAFVLVQGAAFVLPRPSSGKSDRTP